MISFFSHLTYYLPSLILKPFVFEHWKVGGGGVKEEPEHCSLVDVILSHLHVLCDG